MDEKLTVVIGTRISETLEGTILDISNARKWSPAQTIREILETYAPVVWDAIQDEAVKEVAQ